ncbi:MAG: cyclase family protein [Chloroflexota bacterium]
MRIYDISVPISSNLPTWPGLSKVKLEFVETIEAGGNANVTHVSMGVHTGTHVDAPYHFLGGDTRTVESLPLEVLTGSAVVVHLPYCDRITADILQEIDLPSDVVRILFKTRNSELWRLRETAFQENFVAISEDAAEWLVERGVGLVGVDYLSVAPFGSSVPTHWKLLEAGVIIVEGLDLSGVEPGNYTLYCLPLKIEGSDGAPARAILIEK